MMRGLFSAVLGICALSACAPVAEHSAHEPAALIVRGDRLFVSARINGEPVEALLDSGAELTLLDRAHAETMGLARTGSAAARGTGGEAEATFAEGVRIEAAGIVLEDRVVAILDLSDIAARLVGSPVPVIIGRDLFDATPLEISIEEGRITAVSGDGDPAGVRLPMETHRGVQTVPISIEGREAVQADFDLGNGSEMLIGRTYAERAGLVSPGRVVARRAGGGIGGEVVRDIVRLERVEIAGHVFSHVEAAIDDTEGAADANVGVRLLRVFDMTVDFAASTVWLRARR